MWDYVSGPKWVEARKVEQPRFDHSASQYGVLGLWAAADGGAPVPISEWKTLDHAWRSHQNNDGGWTYTSLGGDDTSGTISMTAAGVATLFITHDMLGSAGGGFCHGNQSDPNIDRGIQWIASHWALPNEGYTLFGIERIGAASGLKYLGKYDWYAEGSDFLVKHQREDGSWSMGGTGATRVGHELRMLFLARGRAPVLISKLNYAVDDEIPRPPYPPGRRQPEPARLRGRPRPRDPPEHPAHDGGVHPQPPVEPAPARHRQPRPPDARQPRAVVPQLADRHARHAAGRLARGPDPVHQRQPGTGVHARRRGHG